ncbi:MAG: protein kinase domain-containing protein [Blastocatellia bacterium]
MRYCQSCHRCFGDGAEFCLFDQTPTFLVERLPVVIEGKYRLEQLIAHGGMGSVYRATHQQLERSVAIKILRAEFLADRVVAERFHREARAAARLKHPNIVAVYDFGMLPNGGAYLVMELIEGRSLREELRTHATRYGQMRPDRAAAILIQVCAGIEAAHRHGIIHRDLKPDNVMIEAGADGSERVLVLDFGIAKLKDRDQTMRGITDENTVIGTPNYISPEQCTGQSVDARSDIYSLGVILYEMLTGRTPFAGQNTSAVLLRHLQEPPAPPTRFRSGLSRELEQVVLRALAKNPNQRFSSAAQFAEHLVAAAKSSPRNFEEEFDGEVETRERRPAPIGDEITGVQPRPAANAMWFDQSKPAEDSIENAITRAPTLLIERQPRTRFYVAVAIAALAVIGFFSYLWLSEWQMEADASSSQAAVPAEELPPEAMAVPSKPESVARKTLPSPVAKPELPNASADERAQREVRSVYAEWATSAMRGDWKKHMGFYADRIDYFRDGVLTRAKVEARKRKIFGGFDSYSLRFTQSPQVQLVNNNGAQEAEITFDRRWRFQRGRKRVDGRAQGLITLRRDARGWRIVGEKQIKK